MTRKEQKEIRRQEILEKSLDLFISRGYASTKISDIAEAVNMSQGLLFHYFESKEALFLELISIGINGTNYMMDLQGIDALVFFEKSVEYILNLPKMSMFYVKMFVLMWQTLKNETLPDEIKDKLKQTQTFESCVPLIEQGQANKTIKEGNPLALSLAFWSAIQGTIETLAYWPEYPIPEADWFIDILRRK